MSAHQYVLLPQDLLREKERKAVKLTEDCRQEMAELDVDSSAGSYDASVTKS